MKTAARPSSYRSWPMPERPVLTVEQYKRRKAERALNAAFLERAHDIRAKLVIGRAEK